MLIIRTRGFKGKKEALVALEELIAEKVKAHCKDRVLYENIPSSASFLGEDDEGTSAGYVEIIIPGKKTYVHLDAGPSIKPLTKAIREAGYVVRVAENQVLASK